MNKKIKSLILVTISIVSLITLFSKGDTVVAADPEVSGFGHRIIMPDNQIQKDIGYFDLMMKPEQEQIIQIEFINSSKKEISVSTKINGAKTNSNGVIEYTTTGLPNDASLKHDFEKVVTGPDKVILKGEEKKIVDFKIKMPKENFDGIILGGIEMMEDDQEKNQQIEENNGSMVINKYAYVIPVVLKVNENEVKPAFKYNKIEAGQMNMKNTLFVNYSNTQPNFANNMTTEVQISKKGNAEILFESKQTKLRMAPNTFIDFPVSMGGSLMSAGEYTAHILVTADGVEPVKWTEDFSITQEEAETFNERDVGLTQESSFDIKLLVILIVSFFVMVIILLVIIRSIRSKKNTKSKSTKKNSKSKSIKKK